MVRPVRKRATLAAYASALSFVPAPPVINYVQGYAPNTAQEDVMGNAAYYAPTDTIYYQRKLENSAKAHELGHALDEQVLNDGDRVYFQKLMHAPGGEWNSGTGLQGGATSPNEWFADYYQAAALHLDPRTQSQAAYATIGPVRLKRFEAALARLAKRKNLQPYS